MAQSIRINITMDRETLRLADREAHRQRTSRSEFIRKAVRAHAESQQQQAANEERRQRQFKAAAMMDRLARQFGDWPAERILRSARDQWQ
jgi:metal-responsive CopG/Arc/MetJ family transcriptional regulator